MECWEGAAPGGLPVVTKVTKLNPVLPLKTSLLSPCKDTADLHNLAVSFTASRSPGDEWQPRKIIFLLGCNKSCVKCSTAYIALAKKC